MDANAKVLTGCLLVLRFCAQSFCRFICRDTTHRLHYIFSAESWEFQKPVLLWTKIFFPSSLCWCWRLSFLCQLHWAPAGEYITCTALFMTALDHTRTVEDPLRSRPRTPWQLNLQISGQLYSYSRCSGKLIKSGLYEDSNTQRCQDFPLMKQPKGMPATHIWKWLT